MGTLPLPLTICKIYCNIIPSGYEGYRAILIIVSKGMLARRVCKHVTFTNVVLLLAHRLRRWPGIMQH